MTKFLIKVGRYRVYTHGNGLYTLQFAGNVLDKNIPLELLPYELQADVQQADR